jgi:hypothetical protein
MPFRAGGMPVSVAHRCVVYGVLQLQCRPQTKKAQYHKIEKYGAGVFVYMPLRLPTAAQRVLKAQLLAAGHANQGGRLFAVWLFLSLCACMFFLRFLVLGHGQ